MYDRASAAAAELGGGRAHTHAAYFQNCHQRRRGGLGLGSVMLTVVVAPAPAPPVTVTLSAVWASVDVEVGLLTSVDVLVGLLTSVLVVGPLFPVAAAAGVGVAV